MSYHIISYHIISYYTILYHVVRQDSWNHQMLSAIYHYNSTWRIQFLNLLLLQKVTSIDLANGIIHVHGLDLLEGTPVLGEKIEEWENRKSEKIEELENRVRGKERERKKYVETEIDRVSEWVREWGSEWKTVIERVKKCIKERKIVRGEGKSRNRSH